MSKRRLLAVGLLAIPLAVAAPAAAAPAACQRVKSDFNGDGRADVAAGAPGDSDNKGSVSIVYDPLGTATKQTIPGTAISSSVFVGMSLASGYVDGDCYADLVVGGREPDRIVVLRGSADGLTAAGATTFGTADIPGGAGHAVFGSALAAGDFNHDGFDDIAAGAPGYSPYLDGGEPVPNDGGAVGIFYGSAGGTTATGGRWIMEGADGVAGAAHEFDMLGGALAAGDFDGDGFSDLAIGVPGEHGGDVPGQGGAGGLLAVRGGPGGLTGTTSVYLDQSSPGVPGTPEEGDVFGATLAAADLTGDGRADLVVGSPGEALGTVYDAGTITVLQGSTNGLTSTGSSAFSQDSTDVPGTAELGDRFGGSLSIADLNADGRRDIAVGSPGEDIDAAADTGSVTILYGAGSGPSAKDARYLDQNSAGIPGSNESGDRFGTALTAISGALVVGAPGEQTGSDAPPYTGAFSVLTGGLSAGLFYGPSQFPPMTTGSSQLGLSLT